MRLAAEGFDTDELQTALDGGSEAEIRYRLRLYRERHGITSILGDTLLYEHTLTYTAVRDLFSGEYLIRGAGGPRRFTTFDGFAEGFTAASHLIPREQLPAAGRGVMRCQVILVPRQLVPPFTLLRPFLPERERTSPWRSLSLSFSGGDGA